MMKAWLNVVGTGLERQGNIAFFEGRRKIKALQRGGLIAQFVTNVQRVFCARGLRMPVVNYTGSDMAEVGLNHSLNYLQSPSLFATL
jgi:hypothetical protein